jgi:hypothetical protein
MLTAAEIHQRGYEPEQLIHNLRRWRRIQGGSEYAVATGMIDGTRYATKDPAERLELIDRVLDALRVIEEEQ